MTLFLTFKEKVLLVLSVVLLFGLGIAYIHMRNVNYQYNQEHAARMVDEERMKTYVDDNGNLHAQVEVLTVDRKTYNSMNKFQMDSLARSVNATLRNFQNVLQFGAVTQGTMMGRVDTIVNVVTTNNTTNNTVSHDTVKYYSVNYKDKYMDFQGRLADGRFDATYKVSDSFSVLTFQKPTGFLGMGRKRSYVDISSDNKNVAYTGIKNVELTKIRDKRWSLGPYIGYGYDGTKFKPNVGISIQRSVIRF